MLKDRSCNGCDRRDGDGDGHCYMIEAVLHEKDVIAMSYGHCYRIEVLMHVIDVMAMVDGHCYRIEAVMLVIDVMAMLMDIVIGLKL